MSLSPTWSRAFTLVAPLAAALTLAGPATAKENLSAAEIAQLRGLQSQNTDEYEAPEKCPLVHVVVARGTDEPTLNQSPALDGERTWENGVPMRGADSKPGVFFRIANELYYPSDSTPAFTDDRMLTRADLSYPASTDLVNSIPIGSSKLFNYLREYHGDCENTKIVLQGYSQGALVIGNVLARPSARINWSTSASHYLTPSEHNAIIAVNWLANPGFNRLFLRRAESDYVPGNLINSGFGIGTYFDTNKGVNDGNFIGDNPATPSTIEGYSGITERDYYAFPVKVGNPSFEAVEPALTRDVLPKIRDYCKSRDYICQWGNPNSTTAMHASYAADMTPKKNLYVFTAEKIKAEIAAGLLATW